MMIQASGFHFSSVALDQEVATVRLVSQRLIENRKTILTAMGVQAASWAVQDYRAKSEGKAAAGITWAPITRGAAATRLAARAPWQNDSAALAQLHAQELPLKEELRKKLPKGSKKKSNRGKIASDFYENSSKWKSIRKKRKTIKERRQRNIDKEHSAAKIGIDTGRLVNSIVYDVPELSSVKAPKSSAIVSQGGKKVAFGITKGVFIVTEHSVTLGTNMQYATDFDRLRPIFPVQFDATRTAALNNIATKTAQAIIDKEMKGK